MRLSIAFFVSSILSAYWNGAATYYRGLARALGGRGHALHFFEPDAFSRQQHRDLDALPFGTATVYPPDDREALARCLEQAAHCDWVVKASGIGVNDALLDEAVAELGGRSVRTAYWDVDAPATLARLETGADDPLRALIPSYDAVICYGGGEPVRCRYAALGAQRCEVIHNALDPDTHHPVPVEPRFRSDLSFLGNRLPDRERRADDYFFEPARRLPHRRFVLGGAGWEDRAAALPNLRYLGHVYTAEHNAFNLSAKAVINISRSDMADSGHSPATRFFEAAGCGACLVTDAWAGIGEFLEPEREVLVVDGTDDVVRRVEELDAEQARAIGARARERLLAQHTYAHRAVQLERFLS